MTGRGETATDGLLEREYECDALARALAAASTGDGTVVALEGEAGIGKSALLAYATRSAADTGMRVLTARGGELEQDFGYGVVRQLFDAPLGAMTSAQRAQAVSGAAVLRRAGAVDRRRRPARAPPSGRRCCTACTG